jgi:hypothetical protein
MIFDEQDRAHTAYHSLGCWTFRYGSAQRISLTFFSYPFWFAASRDLKRASAILLERSLRPRERMAQVHQEAKAERRTVVRE